MSQSRPERPLEQREVEERERAYLEALVSLRDRSALFDAVNRVIPRSVFGILGLRSDKRRSRPNRGRNGNKTPPRSTPTAGPSAAATTAPYTPALGRTGRPYDSSETSSQLSGRTAVGEGHSERPHR